MALQARSRQIEGKHPYAAPDTQAIRTTPERIRPCSAPSGGQNGVHERDSTILSGRVSVSISIDASLFNVPVKMRIHCPWWRSIAKAVTTK
jgi:hypothetical protein